MVEENARVLRVEGDIVWIEAVRQSACESCSAQKGCGHSLLAKISQQKLNLPVDRNGVQVQVDDQVIIGVPEQAILKSSLLVYGAPLLFMILLAMLAQGLGFSEGFTILIAFLGLVAGFVVASWRSKQVDIQQWQPKIIKTLSMSQARIPVCEV